MLIDVEDIHHPKKIPLDLKKKSILKSSLDPSIMERPKSAKHNIERLRKSAYLNKLNLINSRHFNNNSTNTNYTVVRPQHDNAVVSSSPNHNYNDNNIEDLDDDDSNNIMAIRRKEQRLKASKSAYMGGLSAAKQRPQSARHNLDKYRNDVLIEKQKKLELLHQIYNQQNNNEINHNFNQNYSNVPIAAQDTNDNIESMFANDDIDNLDGLLIREEDDSNSESEYIDSKPSENFNNKTKSLNQKNKLLSRRIIDTKENNANNLISNTPTNNSIPMRIYRENTFNHLNKTVLVPALNSNDQSNVIFATNPLKQHPANEINSILFQQAQPQQQTKHSISSLSNYTNNIAGNRPPSHENNKNQIIKQKEEQENLSNNNNNGLKTIDSAATNSSSSSTCSSTSSSITASSKANQPQIIHLNELSTNNTDNNTNTKKNNIKNSLLSQELLNEWYKNDEEVDIQIETANNMQDYDSTDYIEFDNTNMKNTSKNQQLQQRNVKSNLQKQSILLALNAGRTSRFSDYSSCSNKTSLSNVNKSTNRTNGYLSRERTNNSMDPWTKRNPTLVAQNVLIKHRAELEQLAARHTSNSRASNHSGLLATSNSKFLLPDTKYFKKNNF